MSVEAIQGKKHTVVSVDPTTFNFWDDWDFDGNTSQSFTVRTTVTGAHRKVL